MTKLLLSEDKYFWWLHVSGWLIIYWIYLPSFNYVGVDYSPQYQTVVEEVRSFGNVLFIISGFSSGLVFRYFYRHRKWFVESIGKCIFRVLFFAFVGGFLNWAFFYLVVNATFKSHLDGTQLYLGLDIYPVYLSVFAYNWGVIFTIWSGLYLLIVNHRDATSNKIKALELENTLKDAQINTLSGQLNPHFLFNGINSIRHLIRSNSDKYRLHQCSTSCIFLQLQK